MAELGCTRGAANCECVQNGGQLIDTLMQFRTDRGRPLHQLCFDLPLLFVFLRHLNCAFCRETLSDLASLRREIELEGAGLVLVHMEEPGAALDILREYGLEDLPRVSDPARELYRAFGLGCGSMLQLLGPRVLWRALTSGVFRKHGYRRPKGDWSQMPGVFLVYEGQVCRTYRHSTAADRPNYVDLAAFPLLQGLFGGNAPIA